MVPLKNGLRSLVRGTTPASPPSGTRALYPKSDGWYDLTSAGVETKVGPSTGGSGAPTGLPAHAPTSATKRYEPRLNAYNFTAANLRKSRAAMSRVTEESGVFNVLFYGDSTLIGYNGTSTKEDLSVPEAMGRRLGDELVAPQAGTGIVAAPSAAGTLSTRWAFTGVVDVATYTALMTMNGGATATYTASGQPGTGVDVYYSDLSTAFTVQVDGGTAVNVTPTGTTAIKKATIYAVGSLPNTNHSIKINALTPYVFIAGLAVTAATGIAVHNLGWGGSQAAASATQIGNGTAPTVSWTDTSLSNGQGLNWVRRGMITASGMTPDLVVNLLGANDIFQSVPVATAIAGLSTMRGWHSSSDYMLAGSWEVTGTNATNWDAYWSAKYTLADTLDVPLIDWRDRSGGLATASTNGLVGSDGIHPKWGTGQDWGRNAANAILG